MNITPPHLQHSHGENSPQLSGLPASADRATRLGEVPHFTCERNQEIKRDCMERLVTPPKRGTSPTWGPPPPCEQALKSKIYTPKQDDEHPRLSHMGVSPPPPPGETTPSPFISSALSPLGCSWVKAFYTFALYYLHYNYAPVTSNCGKNKQYATSHRQVA